MMGLGEVVAFCAVVIGSIAIAGILLDGYKTRMRVRERELELRIAEAQNGTGPRPEPEVEKIEARLRVLERIATDKSDNLAAQIEDLRTPVN